MSRLAAFVALAALVAAGCGKGGDATASEADASPLPKTPNATAADNAKNLQNANMPASAKAIMGGSKPGSN